MADNETGFLSRKEQEVAEKRAAPPTRVIYDIVRRQGEEELGRPIGSLFWSGLAGGITMTTSVIAEGALRHKIPAAVPAREALSNLGYSLGFLMVILGRMQLFTEQTIVTVLPNMAEWAWPKFSTTVRLWAIVFGANLIGTCAGAFFSADLHLVGKELLASMVEVAGPLAAKTWAEVLLQGIPAGFLIASVAWIRAGVTSGEFWVVLVLTYAITLGGFTHVIVGSSEAFLLLFTGHMGVGQALGGIILPALAGNIIGGTVLFALLAHAQVRQEM